MSDPEKLTAEDVQRLTADLEHAGDELQEVREEAAELTEQATAAKGADKTRLEKEAQAAVAHAEEIEQEIAAMRAQLEGLEDADAVDEEKPAQADQDAPAKKGETVTLHLLFPGPIARKLRGKIVKVHSEKGLKEQRCVDVEWVHPGSKRRVVAEAVPWAAPESQSTPAWHR